ncbi:MAG TPA: precorrin-6A reductase [Anaerovoracaceae bacterium]|nr:precorrin-6A reductase [Anaerovoracaceae bacterium]
MPKLLVFAGTTEGRELLESLSHSIAGSELTVYACVATDYGKELLPDGLENIQIRSGRLTEDEMTLLMKEQQLDYVIDTTHPYARLASENIKAACKRAGCNYIRVLRASGITDQMNCLFFNSHEEVAAYLDQTTGNVLLTIGSKELSKYTRIQDYQRRIFPRVLPMLEVVESCYVLGFSGKQLICMQGPFSSELNVALINQINAQYIVTKDSGETGGFLEKYQAAGETGATLLVIGREKEEEGISPESLLELLENTCHIALRSQDEEALGQWFPLFTNISGKTIVVIGAGKIAKRRIETLLKFDCRIKVVAEEAVPEVAEYADEKKLELLLKPYEAADLVGAAYVLAATNEKQLNHEIYEKCKEGDIPVNVADDKEKSDFYFPGIIRKNGVTVGVTAEGKDHGLAKKATRAIANCLDRSLQEDGKVGTEKN